jgi:hypothetical protein
MLEGDWICLTEILEWVDHVLAAHLSAATRHALVLAVHRLCVAFDAVITAHCKEFGLSLSPYGKPDRVSIHPFTYISRHIADVNM